MRLNPSLPRRWCAQMEVGEAVCGSLWQRPCLAYSGYLMVVRSISPETASAQLSAFPMRKAPDSDLGRVLPAKARWRPSQPALLALPHPHPSPPQLLCTNSPQELSRAHFTSPHFIPPPSGCTLRMGGSITCWPVPSAWSVLPPSPLPYSYSLLISSHSVLKTQLR